MSKQEDLVTEAKEMVAGLGTFKKLSLGTICALFVISIVCRIAVGSPSKPQPVQEPAGVSSSLLPVSGQGFVPGGFPQTTEPAPETVEEEPSSLESMLPFFTEATFFAMIGFSLGYASRKVVKLGMIVLGVFFVLLQVLTYAGVTTIDWGRFIEILNDWILNLKENQTITEVLTDRVPTAGALIGGYFLGFRRG